MVWEVAQPTYATVNGSRITDLDLQKRMRMVQREMQSSSMNEDELGTTAKRYSRATGCGKGRHG